MTSRRPLNVIKHVVNDNGGTAVASALDAGGQLANGGSGTGQRGRAGVPGTLYTLHAGKTYNVTESGGPTGYTRV